MWLARVTIPYPPRENFHLRMTFTLLPIHEAEDKMCATVVFLAALVIGVYAGIHAFQCKVASSCFVCGLTWQID